MACRPDDIACALRTISHVLAERPDPWQQTLSALVPIVVGAALALAGSWAVASYQLRRQGRAQSEELFTQTLTDLMRALGDHLARIAAAQRARDNGASWSIPTPLELELRAETVRMVAPAKCAEVTKALKYAVSRIGEGSDLENQARDFRVVGQILRAWRSDGHSTRTAVNRFEGLAPGSP